MRWLRSPSMREDRFWIARIGDEIVGASVLGYPPVRGIVGTEWTATARSVRGRGIARALKCETLMQAIALGVDRVRTGQRRSERSDPAHQRDDGLPALGGEHQLPEGRADRPLALRLAGSGRGG